MNFVMTAHSTSRCEETARDLIDNVAVRVASHDVGVAQLPARVGAARRLA